jgi:FkbM family methyltransferase
MNSDLVFDIGMNHGEDTVYYLSRNFRVVAVEANPILVAENRLKFADAIAAGRLIIEPVGILDHPGTATFWVCDVHDDWSSFDHEMGGRNGAACHALEVECVTLSQLIAKHGVPYYLKIDIERADRHCLESLQSDDLPAYVSIEAHELDYLLMLRDLGYGHFKIIDQMRHNSRLPNLSNENVLSRLLKKAFWYADRVRNKFGKVEHLPGSSGPFGEDTPGSWLPLEDVAYNWLHFHRGHFHRGTLQRLSWYDFHAKA